VTKQEPENPNFADSGTLDTEVLSLPSAAPVFVDESGRRRKLLRRVAYGFGALCMAYGGLVSVSLAGGPVSSSVVLPLPELGDDDKAADAAPMPPMPAPTTPPTSQPPRLITESLRRPSTPSRDTRRAEAPRATRTPSHSPAPVRGTPTPSRTKSRTESGTVKPTPTGATPTTAPPATGTPIPDPTTIPPVTVPVPPKPPTTGGRGGGEVLGEVAVTFTPPPAPPKHAPAPTGSSSSSAGSPSSPSASEPSRVPSMPPIASGSADEEDA
jgi:hypothetical protein